MLRAWLIKLIVALFLGTVLQSNAGSVPVGRIALSVGEAKRVDLEGRTVPLRSGTPISEGDRIITGGDAVAIIVFVDDGRISLRADSELLVKQYKIDPAGADTRLNFELVRGSIRQISGRAARLQPERYRLNTPIASIGVRGTDFLAKTSSDALETFVQEGKIVVLPNLGACASLVQAGACTPLADMAATDAARYIRVLASGQIERRVIATDDVERLFGISLVKASAAGAPGPAATANATSGATPPDGWGHGMPVSDDNGKSRSASSLDLANLVASLPAAPPLGSDLPAAPAPLVLHNTPDLSRQLVWGRFSSADQLPLQLLVPYETASTGRSVTVGELGQYALWRAGLPHALSPALKGEVQFSLHAGEAYLQQGNQVAVAAISNPALGIDFDRATFNSSLTLSHANTGDVALQASGKVDDEGRFLSVSPGQRVGGAISLDGKEAGFLFTREHPLGVFKGITLWNTR